MRDLLGRDLTYLRRGTVIYYSPGQMIRSIRTAALRTGPKHWVWRYAWGLVEEAITELWTAQGGGAPLRQPAPSGNPRKGCRTFR